MGTSGTDTNHRYPRSGVTEEAHTSGPTQAGSYVYTDSPTHSPGGTKGLAEWGQDKVRNGPQTLGSPVLGTRTPIPHPHLTPPTTRLPVLRILQDPSYRWSPDPDGAGPSGRWTQGRTDGPDDNGQTHGPEPQQIRLSRRPGRRPDRTGYAVEATT